MNNERIDALAKEIMLPIRDHLKAGPAAQARVYEALNALALVTATVIHGTETGIADPPSLFFCKALND